MNEQGDDVGNNTDARLTPVTSEREWTENGWADEPEPLAAATSPGTLISVRLDPELARFVRRAARIEGVTQAEFVRRVVQRNAVEMGGPEPIAVDR